ncbi:MAG TPA: N-acetylmuramoyl-L-alanine amidase [Novosphingobium sp.]|nr:N-acetylmuramoyl-L-alanine amidase [Novosphingobium sp.]
MRPSRLEVTDRFPMLAFSLRSSEGARLAEVVLASDLALFGKREGRNSGTFYSSREHGMLTIPPGGSVFTVPPEVLARFIAADRLYFALATASAPAGQDWIVDLMPGAASPYISLAGLSDRALRRVRVFPTAPRARLAPRAALTEWAGDHIAPAAPPPPPSTASDRPTPAPVPYNDGFGPLPSLQREAPGAVAPPPVADAPTATAPEAGAPAAQGLGRVTGRGFEAEPDESDTKGIDGPVIDEPYAAAASALAGGRTSPLTTAEYSGATRIMASPNFRNGRRGDRAIDRIVIHITSSPQRPSLGSWFMNPASEASSHYMVDQNGEIIQFVREQDTAWHARLANSRSIGIEHVAVERGGARYQRRDGSWQTFPYDPPTEAELRASAALVAHLCRKYGLTPDRTTIVGHSEIDAGTTHSNCPDGAWDWDSYMALVAECYAQTPPTGVGDATAQGLGDDSEIDPETRGIDAAPYTEDTGTAVAAGLALGAAEYDRVARTVPSPAFTAGRSGTAIDRIVIHITDAPTTSSTVNTFSAAGAQASAHYLVGQDGEIVQFVSEADTAWHAKGANRRSVGIEHVAIKTGGADYPRRDGTMQHYDALPPTQLQYEESALLVSHLCDKYGLPKTRATIIGHNEADPTTSHGACPTGNWDWDYFMRIVETGQCQADAPTGQSLGTVGRTLGGDNSTVEIKYRAFIPSPAISGPYFDNFEGDGRGFSYSGGTSRGDITFTVDVSAGGGVSNLSVSDRHWSPTHQYSSSDTSSVSGKPGWWLDLNAGATPVDTGTCAADDDTLRAYIGAPGTTGNVLAMAENASIVSIAMSGSNPLLTGAPAIDADVSVLLRRTADGGIEARVYGSHDGFPAHELYVNGNALFTYDPVAADNGPSSLLPPEDIDQDTSWTTVASGSASSQGLSARALEDESWTLNWDEVESIPQPTGMGCWATSTAMILGWKNRQSISPGLLAKCNGYEPSMNAGITAADAANFIPAVGLQFAPAACYTPEGFRDLLERYGPLFVFKQHPGIHAVVVTGMYRDGGNYFVRVTDPMDRVIGTPGAQGGYASPPAHLTGSRYIMSYDGFAAEYEAEAGFGEQQIAHGGTVFGREPNRGNASGAGYAQGLGDDAIGTVVPPATTPAPLPVDATITRTTTGEGGRSYDLAQLVGMVRPANALAGGAGMTPLLGEHVALDDWPYIDGPGGRSQAGVAIDWKFDGPAVGDIVIVPSGGSLADGWSAAVRADIEAGSGTPDRTVMLVRVTTTFSRAGEKDQLGVSEVTLSGDGRAAPRHCGEPDTVTPSVTAQPAPVPLPVKQASPQLVPA